MEKILEELKDLQSDCCVSLLLKTHRTHPGNQQDPIRVKNLLAEAESRLGAIRERKSAELILGNLHRLAAEIDHEHNLESLALFANETSGHFVRLPVEVEDRVVIDSTFATRDLVRAMHAEEAYFALVLSRKSARLVEAFADRPVREWEGDFPMDYGTLYTTDREERSRAQGSDNLVEEFFNRVDKAFQEAWKARPLPLVLVTDERNIAHFRKVTDQDRILATTQPLHDDEETHRIATHAWAAARPALAERNASRLGELHAAVSGQNFLSDLNDIWQALKEGRGATLFVQRGYFQPARIEGARIVPMDEVGTPVEGFIDDLIDEMIEMVLALGGDVVFLDRGPLEEFQGVALVTRW